VNVVVSHQSQKYLRLISDHEGYVGRMPETVDAVVVGAGHNGLVAANLLADAGWDVTVLEATDAPGGAVRSAEYVAPGFRSDICSSFYPLAVPQSPLAQLDLGRYGLHWTHAPAVAAHLMPDGRAAVLSRDPDATAESVAAFAPADATAWKRAYGEWRDISAPLLTALLSPFPPVRGTATLLRRAGVADAMRLARRFILSARMLADELFRGDGAKLLLGGMALHTDLAPDDAASGGFGWLLAMVAQEHGFPVPVGGAQRITDALVARLRSRGGRVLCQVPVDRVVVAGGRALGVRAADGRLWRARRAVLADVTAPALYRDLVGLNKLPARLRADLDAFGWDSATVKIDWALSGPMPWTNPAVSAAGTVHLGGDLAALARYSLALASGRRPTEPFLLVGQMTTADSTRSPAGTESMWAYTHLPRRVTWDTAAVHAHAKLVEERIETYAPGFRRLIIGRQVLGPDDLQRHNPSLMGGAVNAGTSAVSQQLIFRPVPGLGRADTPIDRLYLAGASAHPGGGVHGGPGANAARAALARWRPVLGGAYAAAVRAAQRSIYA
jgi:phytoene dehydrogenase-like protein